MALHFLVDDASAAVGDTAVLTGAEAHHAVAVRRVRVGEEVTVGDGAGVWLTGVVEAAERGRVVVRVRSRDEIAAAAPRLVLVQALAKGDRDELAVQAATELGADEIVPWQAARSVSRWTHAARGSAQRDAVRAEGRGETGDKLAKGVARWQAIVREAAKQAHRSWVPTVTDPVSTAQLARRAATACVLVLEPTASVALTQVSLGDADEIVLVVGPEGGIATDELRELADAGAVAVRLGETVLRTSTAGPAALAVISARLGRW
ncbi:MAG: RsmE family RNA methyltransferase [Microbacterium sp.]